MKKVIALVIASSCFAQLGFAQVPATTEVLDVNRILKDPVVASVIKDMKTVDEDSVKQKLSKTERVQVLHEFLKQDAQARLISANGGRKFLRLVVVAIVLCGAGYCLYQLWKKLSPEVAPVEQPVPAPVRAPVQQAPAAVRAAQAGDQEPVQQQAAPISRAAQVQELRARHAAALAAVRAALAAPVEHAPVAVVSAPVQQAAAAVAPVEHAPVAVVSAPVQQAVAVASPAV